MPVNLEQAVIDFLVVLTLVLGQLYIYLKVINQHKDIKNQLQDNHQVLKNIEKKQEENGNEHV